MSVAIPFKRSALTLTLLSGILTLSALLSLARYFCILASSPGSTSPRPNGIALIVPLAGWIAFNIYATWSAWAAESEETAKKWFLCLGKGLIIEFAWAFFAPGLLLYAFSW